ncbi:AbrB family transcriptional regulator [Paenibacillus kobensis]|uniref:AbrB family transcriptional regulator n=1 Tax=Paenibacillus kobensis TaxID=59841 RepID=UPI001FE9762D|nr:AbrB family transcriptional regulator [Paenibacillus kobensis]
MYSHPAVRLIFTSLISLLGGIVFTLLHIPLPWLLGPMTFILIGTRFVRTIQPSWPRQLRDSALIVLGYSIGLSFTVETLHQMGHQLPTMVMATMLLLLFCVLMAWIITKVSGLPFPTVLMGSIPGGLTQIVVLAEETKGIDLTVVTFLQVSRLLMIIFCVPAIVFSPLLGADGAGSAAAEAMGGISARWGDMDASILLFAVICVAAALLANKIRFPSAFLLGPMISTAALHLSSVSSPALPMEVLDAAQYLVGTYVGLLLKPEQLKNKARIITLALLSGLTLIVGSLGLSMLLTKLHDVSPATSFLSLAPGGMDQMGIIANEINADISIVTVYQIFRTWFIYFAVPPLLRMTFRALERRQQRQKTS